MTALAGGERFVGGQRTFAAWEYFYHAPDAEDLAAIYRAIAVELPCARVRLGGRR